MHNKRKTQTCFQASLLLFLLPPNTLFLLEALVLLLALLEDGGATFRLLLRHLLLRRRLHLGELLAPAGVDGVLESVVVVEHPRQAVLGLDVLQVSRAAGLQARFLCRLEDSAIVRLLHLVVLREKGSLLLAVRTLDVIEALSKDAHALVELLLLLLSTLR